MRFGDPRRFDGGNGTAKARSCDHDANGDLTARTDGDSQNTCYMYDGLGRQSRIDFPEGTSAYFSYSAVGSLMRIEEPGGRTAFGYGTRPYGAIPYGGQAGSGGG